MIQGIVIGISIGIIVTLLAAEVMICRYRRLVDNLINDLNSASKYIKELTNILDEKEPRRIW